MPIIFLEKADAINKIPLTKSQSEIMSRFYSKKKTSVIFSKKERKEIWDTTKKKGTLENFNEKAKISIPQRTGN